MFFDLTGSSNPSSFKLVLLFFPALLVFQLFNRYVLKGPYNNYHFIWMILLSISICIFSREMYFLSGGKQAGSFPEAFVFSFSGLILIITILNKLGNISFRMLFFMSLPLFLSPLISVVSDEAYLISNNYNLLLLNDEWFFIFIITLSYLVYLYIYKKFAGVSWTTEGSMRRFVLPFSLLGILFFLNYRPFIDQPSDLFELANPANALMRIFAFHEWPFAEFINSHLLSELFFPIVFSLINGYSGGVEFLLYNFIQLNLMVFIAWFFLSRIFTNPMAIFGLILLLPAIDLAFPGYYAWALLSIFIIYHLVRNYSFKRLFFLLSFNLFLLFWKVEIGLSSSIATFMILVWYFIVHFQKKLMIDLLKAIAVIAIFLLLISIYFVFIKKIDLYNHFLQAKAYFGAEQEHGFSILSFGQNKFYYFHYFVFPISILVLLFSMLFRTLLKPIKEKQLLFLSLFFLSVYYLVNAQRGLVRHSLTQNSDTYISSFLFMILPLYLYYFLKPSRKAMVFTLIMYIFLIGNLKVPEAKARKTLIEDIQTKFTEKDLLPKFDKKVHRVKRADHFEIDEISGLRKLMNNNFSKEASFIDFSNSPMLYFYTQRRVPSYFCQYMQNTITPFLQEQNIDLLNELDLPLVVFSNIPETFFDLTDGVPNIIRYEHIRNYIYKNYSPLGKINHHYIWLKNGLEIDTTGIIIEAYSPAVSVQNLGLYPYLKAKEINVLQHMDQIQEFPAENRTLEINLQQRPDRFQNYLLLMIDSFPPNDQQIKIVYSTNDTDKAIYNIVIKQGINYYLLELSSVFSWIAHTQGKLKIQYNKQDLQIKSIQMLRKNNKNENPNTAMD